MSSTDGLLLLIGAVSAFILLLIPRAISNADKLVLPPAVDPTPLEKEKDRLQAEDDKKKEQALIDLQLERDKVLQEDLDKRKQESTELLEDPQKLNEELKKLSEELHKEGKGLRGSGMMRRL